MHIHLPKWVQPSLVVSVLALVFTIASFWWIQVRRGRLRSYPPTSYAGAFPGTDVRLVLPLVLYNPAPAPITILAFRMRIDPHVCRICGRGHDPTVPATLSWQAVQGQLEPAGARNEVRHGTRVLPSAFPIEGRRAVERFIEFARKDQRLRLADGPYPATVEVLLAHRRLWRWLARRGGWRRLVEFELHTELVEKDGRDRWLVRTNDPEWQP